MLEHAVQEYIRRHAEGCGDVDEFENVRPTFTDLDVGDNALL